MERCPAIIALIRLDGTWIARARRFMLRPRSSSVSLRISPGCTGAILSVVFRDFDVMGSFLFPGKADPVLIIEAQAVLALAISAQRFEVVAGGGEEIGGGWGVVERGQPPQRYSLDALEFLHPFAFP